MYALYYTWILHYILSIVLDSKYVCVYFSPCMFTIIPIKILTFLYTCHVSDCKFYSTSNVFQTSSEHFIWLSIDEKTTNLNFLHYAII